MKSIPTIRPASATPATPAASITIASFSEGLAKRAGTGDTAALQILITPRSLILSFAEFLQSAATRQKTSLATILSLLPPEDLERLTRELPKESPQLATIKAALQQSRASLRISVEYHAPGTTTVGFGANKSPSTCALITVKGYDSDGKAISEKKGLRFWSLILRLAADQSALAALQTAIESAN